MNYSYVAGLLGGELVHTEEFKYSSEEDRQRFFAHLENRGIPLRWIHDEGSSVIYIPEFPTGYSGIIYRKAIVAPEENLDNIIDLENLETYLQQIVRITGRTEFEERVLVVK